MGNRLRYWLGMLPRRCSYFRYFHGYILVYRREQTNHFAWSKRDLKKLAWKYYGN